MNVYNFLSRYFPVTCCAGTASSVLEQRVSVLFTSRRQTRKRAERIGRKRGSEGATTAAPAALSTILGHAKTLLNLGGAGGVGTSVEGIPEHLKKGKTLGLFFTVLLHSVVSRSLSMSHTHKKETKKGHMCSCPSIDLKKN